MTQVFPVRVRDFAHGGAGVGSSIDDALEPRTWFVPATIPGEVVHVERVREAKRMVWGKLVQVVQKAPERRAPGCEFGEPCGGCGWLHVAAERQAQFKADIVRGQLRRIAAGVDGVHPSASVWHYRRRVRQQFRQTDDGWAFGQYRSGTHGVTDLPRCRVLVPPLQAALERARELTPHLPRSGELHGLCDEEGQVVLGLLARPSRGLLEACQRILCDSLVGVVVRGGRKRETVGRARLSIDRDSSGRAVEIGPFGFAQAQSTLNRELVQHVAASCGSARVRDILELYAGAGNFTRSLSDRADRVLACESEPEAARSLAKGVERWRTSARVRVEANRVESVLSVAKKRGHRFATAVLDPPRSGAGVAVMRQLAELVRSRVVYVSCDPATLARDLRVLVDEGFEVENVSVFDMMPMTSEVETVVTLVRRGGLADG